MLNLKPRSDAENHHLNVLSSAERDETEYIFSLLLVI